MQYQQSGRRQTYQQEMRQKPVVRDTFFSMKHESQHMRPTSVATEFVDTDWDEDDIISEAEDNSPRISLQSVSLHGDLFRMLLLLHTKANTCKQTYYFDQGLD